MSIFFVTSCNESYNHPLGNNLSLWDGDRKEDRIIVYCTGICHGGIQVVPTSERQYADNQHAEYVETATSNEKWVVAKTIRIKEKTENYWIISKAFDIENLNCSSVNCDSILQSHVTGPLNFVDFEKKSKELNIILYVK